jgi:hypothetical protein
MHAQRAFSSSSLKSDWPLSSRWRSTWLSSSKVISSEPSSSSSFHRSNHELDCMVWSSRMRFSSSQRLNFRLRWVISAS